MTDSDVLHQGVVVEKYTVEGVLGHGGMATVYKVRHNLLGTTHALKVLTQSRPSIRRRLMLEGQVQARLTHTNIVGVTDVLELEEGVGLVLEYVPGTDLEALIARKRLSLPQLDALAEGIFRGVEYAHAHQLIHRDLKPANVLLKSEGRRIIPKVADFGLVKDSSELSATRSGVAMGTPRYMAPEQIRDAKTVDLRSDVFSLGALTYAMVTGQETFSPDEDDIVKVFMAIYAGDFIPVKTLRPDVPDRIANAIHRALEVEPADRHPTVASFRAAWYDVSEDGDLWEFSEQGARGVEITESIPQLDAMRTMGQRSAAPTHALMPHATSRLGQTVPTLPPATDEGMPSSRRTTLLLAGGLALASLGIVASLVLFSLAVGAGALSGVGSDAPAEARVVVRTPPTPQVVPSVPPASPPDDTPPGTDAAPSVEPRDATDGTQGPSAPEPSPAQPAAAPVPDSRPAPRPAPPPAPSPAPAAPEPPAPEPAVGVPPAPVSTTATFLASGGRAYLRANGVDHSPGDVPPGTYAVHASVDGTPVTVAEPIRVAAGQQVVVTCKPMLKLCEAKVLP